MRTSRRNTEIRETLNAVNYRTTVKLCMCVQACIKVLRKN